MALHILPDPETGHRRDETCPCSPATTVGEAEHPRGRGQVYRGAIVTHQPFVEAPTPALDDEDLDEEFGPDCGHTIVEVDGEQHHHQIPDDGVPHAPTSECGCGPQRVEAGGHTVYLHADPQGEADAALWDSLDLDGGPQ